MFSYLWRQLPDALDTLFSSSATCLSAPLFGDAGRDFGFFDSDNDNFSTTTLSNAISGSMSSPIASELRLCHNLKDIIEFALTSGELSYVDKSGTTHPICHSKDEVTSYTAQREIFTVIEHIMPLFTECAGGENNHAADAAAVAPPSLSEEEDDCIDFNFTKDFDIIGTLGDFMSEDDDDERPSCASNADISSESTPKEHFPSGNWAWNIFSIL